MLPNESYDAAKGPQSNGGSNSEEWNRKVGEAARTVVALYGDNAIEQADRYLKDLPSLEFARAVRKEVERLIALRTKK